MATYALADDCIISAMRDRTSSRREGPRVAESCLPRNLSTIFFAMLCV
ncbi:Hypothetical protein A7982_02801 [Minicystis rosea]|nr:Hypothetical protein A7982_02801 [Minicystis rosea]